MRPIARNAIPVVVVGFALWTAGCGQALSIFDPGFVQTVAGSAQAATLPGDAPAIVLAVENRTSLTIEAQISYRVQSDVVETYTAVVQGGQKTAQAIICPIEEITLGDISDLSRVGARVRFGLGTDADPYIEVEPFGVLLKAGQNYDCGDAVTFVVTTSSQTRSGYQTIAYIRRAE